MKTVFSFFLLFQLPVFACELKQPIVSLSGPITLLLKELELLDDKNLKAISSFHPIEEKCKVHRYGGGLFLSKKVLNKHKDNVFFYDKSRELRKYFRKASLLKKVEVDLLGYDAFQGTEISLKKLKEFLGGCEKKIEILEKKLAKQKMKLSKFKVKPSIFFLGKIGPKLPETIISNDGLVKSLIKMNDLKTYPSKLMYVSWAGSILKKIKKYNYIGLTDTVEIKLEKLSDNRINLSYPGALVPGIGQVNLLDWMISSGGDKLNLFYRE